MKTNILRYALLLSLTALVGTASCSGTTEPQNPDGPTDDPDKLTALTVKPETLSLTVGQTANLTVDATPETASLKNLRWSSSDNKIATVDESGKVTATSKGNATITASCDGQKSSCEVTVTEAPISLQRIDIAPAGVSLRVEEKAELKATLVPENADVEGDIVWESNKPEVATVDQSGQVIAIAEGSATITAKLGDVTGTCSVTIYSEQPERTFTFFQLNLWEELSRVKNGQGREVLFKQLAELKPDVASFCEFRSIDGANSILKEACEELFKRTGIQYYYTCRSGSGTRGLLTRHPVISTDAVISVAANSTKNNDWFYRTVIDFYGQEMAVYASHANYTYYACYLPRGYGDGSPSWDKLTEKELAKVNLEYILEREEQSERWRIGVDLVADTKEQHAQGRLCVFGGDLNQPSHLDWTEAAKDKYEHNDYVVPWSISKTCYEGGLADAFRTVYPNEVTHPGVTWPVSNPEATHVTQWAAEADERDRIDYVYYMPDEGFQPVKAQMVGPSDMISHSKIVPDTFANKAEELIEPVGGVWPSDHRGLFITFKVKFE